MTGNAAAGPALVSPLPPTILVVDDDAAMRTILGMTLRAFGYLALAAGDGEEALQMARDHPEIRVILLDVVMPGLSGRELADQLRGNLPDASILFCSGHPPELMSLHGIDLKSDQFMQKPCRPPDLQRKVEELLATA
jgi:two-component system, cell cycle sensor histidine kinase and response regulator CckA